MDPRTVADRMAGGPPDSWRQRDQDVLAVLAAHAQHPVAAFFAEVGAVGAGSFEDPQAEQAERGQAGYATYRAEFSKLIWQLASPKWPSTTPRSNAAQPPSRTPTTSRS